MNNSGQSVLAEYAVIFFIVIGAAVAVTPYVQRAFEARIHSARNFALDSVVHSGACDANCVQATGNLSYEYEPYYSIMVSDVLQSQQDSKAETPGNAEALGVKYIRSSTDNTNTNSTASQLPPCTDAPGGCP